MANTPLRAVSSCAVGPPCASSNPDECFFITDAAGVRITFDPDVASYRDILEVFFATHDPTTRDRQGNDVGTQYRSAIFYGSDEQRSIAEKLIRELDAKHIWDDPIVTALEPAATFYRAEDYHQNYFRDNAQQPYCTFVVAPKVRKFREKFAHKLRRSAVQRSH